MNSSALLQSAIANADVKGCAVKVDYAKYFSGTAHLDRKLFTQMQSPPVK